MLPYLKIVGDGLATQIPHDKITYIITPQNETRRWTLEPDSSHSIWRRIWKGEQRRNRTVGVANRALLAVKDTAAWTIGRICEFRGDAILPQHLQMMMRAPEDPQGEGALLVGLKDDPRVATNVCWARPTMIRQRCP